MLLIKFENTMAYSSHLLTLHCTKCNTQLATSDMIMLATVPPSQTHVSIRKEKEDEAFERIRKIPNSSPKKVAFCPYRILCKQCNDHVGSISIVEENSLICFKIENVHFKRGYEEIKGKKLKHIKDKITQYGLEVVNVSQLRNEFPQGANTARKSLQPLIYSDTHFTDHEILSLTKDPPRQYQRELFLQALQRNTLVYLPTGSGKTLIAAMVLSCMKKLNPDKLMVLLVDRIPLVYQQSDYIRYQVPDLRVEILAGDIGRFPGDKSRWIATVQALSENKIDLLVMTSQILLNLMADDCPVLRMSDISVMVFDEAHHCLGNHSYNQIMRDFYKKTSDRYKPLVLALTASPAGTDKLDTTITNLETLLSNLCACARMPVQSRDLELYWNRPETSYHVVPLNTKQIQLQSDIELYLDSLTRMIEDEVGNRGALDASRPRVLSQFYRGALRKLIERCHGDKNRVKGLALAEHAMHMLSVVELNNILGNDYAVECIEECIRQLQTATSPMEKLKKALIGSFEPLKALESSIRELRQVSNVFTASDRYQHLVAELHTFARQVERDGTSRSIIFVKMRKTAYKLCERLRQEKKICERLNPAFLVGHGQGSDGMDWRGEQEEILKKFRSGQVKLIVSTSVLEEGLDVPACNQIIRFDSALTLRALVQGRGRASRRPDSSFVVICSDTTEQLSAYDAIRKEENMEEAMRLQQRNVNNWVSSQAVSFGCQVKKPDLSSAPIEEIAECMETRRPEAEDHDIKNDYSEETLTINERGESLASGGPRKRRKNYVPSVSIAVHNVVFGTKSKEVGLLTEYFEKHFEVKSFKIESGEVTETKNGTSERALTSRVVRIQLEPSEHGKFSSKDKFFGYVAESWCSRQRALLSQTDKLWLRCDDKSQKRKSFKPVLVIKPEAMTLGYFVNEARFCLHWPVVNSKLENIRISFEHDLRTMLICFTVPNPRSKFTADLYKVQIRYSEIREYILVDRPRSSETYDLYLTLRHPPRMFKAKSFVKKDQDVDDENNDFEDWYFDEDEYDSDLDRGYTDEFKSESEESDASEDADKNEEENREKSDNETLLTSSDIASIDDVVNWERVIEIEDSGESFGSCCTFNFTFKAGEWNELKEMLVVIAKYDKKVFYVSMSKSRARLPEVSIPRELPFEVKYATQCVLHSYPFIRGRITSKFNRLLSSKPKKVVLAALTRLGSILDRNGFCDPEAKFESLLEETIDSAWEIKKHLLPTQCTMMKRMVITPTRLLFFTPEVMSKNRVLRQFNTDQFLCVNVRDEDFSRLSSAAGAIDKILERLQSTLDNGVIVGGESFLYLGSSNSQLRNHGCWFVRPSPHPEEIREWMGDFKSIRCVGTFMARMGQCFSTSMDAVGIDVNEGTSWEMVDDIETPDESYCFSDGVGRISDSLAQKVAKEISLDFLPSAIQIRFAGCKGVLTLDPTLPDKTAVFRPSMRKFESPHRRLEVLQTSRPQAVFLNHQLIMLLSNLGVPDEVFMSLQRAMLDKLAGMLVNERLGTLQLASGAKTGIAYKRLSEAGLQLTTEPFFKSLLVALYKERMQNLLSRARILLPTAEARLMIGVMDETGTLEPGQVFVQYSMTSNDPDRYMDFSKSSIQILTGPVVVTRNPCLHPGDVRQLTAVSVPQLAHLVDCVVFPNHGPRPHPSEMAGGDLDGDLYFVCWMKDLLPKRKLYPPMNYEAPPKKELREPITVRHMTEFVAEYIRYDQLGVIDNAHKAQADCQEGGVESPLCLDLADRHSRAVDAPKTGDWPEMPKEAKVTVFPDFMMKSDKPSYPSDKVLGKLYRECRAFKESIARDIPLKNPHIEAGLLVPGFQGYQQEAREAYEEYSSQLQTLMNLYGIETEGELVSGCFVKLHSRLGREKVEIAEIIRRILTKIRENCREKFFEEFDDFSDNEVSKKMQQKASAWYYVAYSYRNINNVTEKNQEDPPQTQFLSFPWLVDDVMLTIRLNYASQEQESQSVVTSISESVFNVFEQERDVLLHGFEGRLQIKYSIWKAMPREALGMFGSSASFLFRPDSDLDLCILYPMVIANREELERDEQIAVLKKFLPLMRKMFKHARIVESARIPVITGSNPAKRAGILANVKADLTASWDGLLKSIVLSNYIKFYPGLLPLLRLLVNWGHVTGLAGHGVDAGIKSTVLVFLMLIFCVAKGVIQNFDLEEVWNQCYEISTAGKVKDGIFVRQWQEVLAALQSKKLFEKEKTAPITLGDQQIGEILLTLFQDYNATLDMEMPETFAYLLGVRKLAELLDPEHLRLLKEHMQRAFHLLALYGDAEVLLTISASEIDRVIFLSEALSYTMAGSERHNAFELSKKTGARVTIRPSLPGSGFGLVLQAIGTESAVAAVERALNAMATQALRNKAAVMSMCFVKEAKHMLFEGCLSDDDRVTLVPYYGDHHSTHDSLALYVPILANPRPGLHRIGAAYTRHEFLSFQERFLTQVQVIERDFVSSIHGEMVFAIHFGRLYVLNIPKSFTEDSESPSVSVFQTNLARGYKPRPSILSVPRNIRKYGRVRGSHSKGKYKKRWNNKGKCVERGEDGKKIPKEKVSRSSFFTGVSAQEKAVDFLIQRGFSEAQMSPESYSVEIHTDHEFSVVTDRDFRFKEVKLPKLRWCAVDVKRAWKENPENQDVTDLDGVETDVRFVLKTRPALSSDDIRGTSYEQYRDALQPQPQLKPSSCPFVVKPEIWKNVALIRHKKARIFRLGESADSASEFKKSLCVSVNEITEYSRPKMDASTFNKVFTRCEVVVKAGLPSSWSNTEAVEKLLRDSWAFGFAFATHLSD